MRAFQWHLLPGQPGCVCFSPQELGHVFYINGMLSAYYVKVPLCHYFLLVGILNKSTSILPYFPYGTKRKTFLIKRERKLALLEHQSPGRCLSCMLFHFPSNLQRRCFLSLASPGSRLSLLEWPPQGHTAKEGQVRIELPLSLLQQTPTY